MIGQGFTRPPIWTRERRGGLIIAAEREYEGHRFFELRQWAENGTKPTKQGVTMPPEAVAELAQAMLDYATSIAREGGAG